MKQELKFSKIYKVEPFNLSSIEFYNPYDKEHSENKLINDGSEKSEFPNYKGVYVWGFKFKNGKGPFMPYYVGKADRTRIYKRLSDHFHFSANYHVIKKSQLSKFNKFLKTDEEINQIAKDCKSGLISPTQRDSIFNTYRENYFDYLNKKFDKEKNKYIALDELHKSPYNTNDLIQGSKTHYQINFYACWIKYTKVDSGENATVKENIEKLEKYIHLLVKNKNKQKLIGEDLTIQNKDWSLHSLIEQFGKINTKSLEHDCFI